MSNGKVDIKRSDREAIKRYNMGLQLGASTDIAESPSYGYGELDRNGFWEFPLYFENDNDKHDSERKDAFDDYMGPDKPLKQKLKELPVRLRMYWQRFLWRVVNTFRRK